jgi:hypothetical protein
MVKFKIPKLSLADMPVDEPKVIEEGANFVKNRPMTFFFLKLILILSNMRNLISSIFFAPIQVTYTTFLFFSNFMSSNASFVLCVFPIPQTPSMSIAEEKGLSESRYFSTAFFKSFTRFFILIILYY